MKRRRFAESQYAPFFLLVASAIMLRLVVRLSAIAGQVVLFDNVKLLTAANLKDYNYTGKTLDGTGLVYFGGRWYDPEIGRFITQDPGRQGLNWYTYCGNNPVIRVDPNGQCWMVAGAVAGAVIGAGIGIYQSYTIDGQWNWGRVGAWTLGGALVGTGAGALVDIAFVGVTAAATSWAQAASTIAVGANSATKGRVFENWFYEFNKIAGNCQQIAINGIGRIDAFKNGIVYELKNYDWSKYSSLGGVINNFIAQATKYQNLIGQYLNGQQVTGLIYYFSSKPPIEVIKALEKVGVTVQWVQ